MSEEKREEHREELTGGLPAQKQWLPGSEAAMQPKPQSGAETYRGCAKLSDRVAIITGADSGIGRAVAVAYAREGADVVVAYLNEHEDAKETCRLVEEAGRKALAIAGDVAEEGHCQEVVRKALDTFGHVDILVNNAAEQHEHEKFEEITVEDFDRTFKTNIYGYFLMTRATLPHLGNGRPGVIINTGSITGIRGSKHLVDYAATKGAIHAFTKSLAQNLADRGIRVNCVAPGPVWTPLIPASFPKEQVEQFGKNVPMGRPAQPEEIAPTYVFLASDDSSYYTGEVLAPTGGETTGR